MSISLTTAATAATAATAIAALYALGRRTRTEERPTVIAKEKNNSLTVIFTTLKKAKIVEKIVNEQDVPMNFIIVTSFPVLKNVLTTQQSSNEYVSLITDNVFTVRMYKNIINFLNGINTIDLWILFQSNLVNSALKNSTQKRINSKTILFGGNVPVAGKYEMIENINSFLKSGEDITSSIKIRTFDEYFLFLKEQQDNTNRILNAENTIEEIGEFVPTQASGVFEPGSTVPGANPTYWNISESDQYKSFNTILLNQSLENIELYYKEGKIIAYFYEQANEQTSRILRLVRDSSNNYDPISISSIPVSNSFYTEILNNRWYVDVETILTTDLAGNEIQLNTVQKLLDNKWFLIGVSETRFLAMEPENRSFDKLKENESFKNFKKNESEDEPALRTVETSAFSVNENGNSYRALEIFYNRMINMNDLGFYNKTEYQIGLEESEIYKISFKFNEQMYVRFLQKLDLFGNGLKLFEVLVQQEGGSVRPFVGARFDSSLTYYLNKTCYYDYSEFISKYIIEDKEYAGVTIQSSSKGDEYNYIRTNLGIINEELCLYCRKLTPKNDPNVISTIPTFFGNYSYYLSNRYQANLNKIFIYYGLAGEFHIFYDFIADVFLVRLGTNNDNFFNPKPTSSNLETSRWFILYRDVNDADRGNIAYYDFMKKPVDLLYWLNNKGEIRYFYIQNTSEEIISDYFYTQQLNSRYRMIYKPEPYRPCSKYLKSITYVANSLEKNSKKSTRLFVDYERYSIIDSLVSVFNSKTVSSNDFGNNPSAPPYSFLKFKGFLYGKVGLVEPRFYYQQILQKNRVGITGKIISSTTTLSELEELKYTGTKRFNTSNIVVDVTKITKGYADKDLNYDFEKGLNILVYDYFGVGYNDPVKTSLLIDHPKILQPTIPALNEYYLKKSFNTALSRFPQFLDPLTKKVFKNDSEFNNDFVWRKNLTKRDDGSEMYRTSYFMISNSKGIFPLLDVSEYLPNIPNILRN